MSVQTQYRLTSRPVGIPGDDVWEVTHDAPMEVGEGDIAVDVEFLSIDPAMRGWMNDVATYIPPVKLGEVMRAGGIGTVTASRSDKFSVGDIVIGATGVQSHYVGTSRGFNKIFPEVAPVQTFLGGLGMPGASAYFGLLEIGKPSEGDTVLVSAAGGAVGSVAGQIARIKGCRVVGIAGGKEKCDQVVSNYGFDACIDYKSTNFAENLRKECPDGVNIYFDNVGGNILELALENIAMHGRIVLCGAISQYNGEAGIEVEGPRNYLQLLVQRARMEGFVVMDYQKRFPEAIMQMATWMNEKKLRFDEHIVEGIDSFPEALRMLFHGKNQGKLIIKI